MSREFKPYPKYKDSGVEWLGQVPEGWEVTPLKRAVRQSADKSTDGSLQYLGLENILPWTGVITTDSDAKYSDDSLGIEFLEGDVLFGKLRPYLAKVALPSFNGRCTSELLVLRPEKLDGKYLRYFLSTPGFIDRVNSTTFGAQMPRANWESIGGLHTLIPEDKGKAIASFLDQQTSQIDEVIKATEESIALLQEERKSIISHAVTKGLDPKVKLKDSGIEWLGQIPEHWEAKKTSWYFTAKKGKNAAQLTKEYCATISGDYPVYSGQTENNGVMSSITEYEFDAGEDGCLFSTTVGSQKVMTVMHIKGRFSLSQNCMIMLPTQRAINVRYAFYHFQPLFEYEKSFIPSHMQASFRMEDFYQYRLALPPLAEQEAISSYLDEKTKRIDSLIAEKGSLIESLREYRSSLIFEAVTGKIDLREEAA
ncbi:MAG: restriction endonuclease subunit S [Proteobacteria bacterium]|nr:restriction endonuclease subunit S [Pseudomonadota bacterium]